MTRIEPLLCPREAGRQEAPELHALDAASPAADWAAARQLVGTYAEALGSDLSGRCFGGEMESLPATYAPPDGAFVLVRCHGRGVGCCALRRLDGGRGELRRLFVLPCCRGRGLARAMVERLLDEARREGYREVVLHTHESMTAARALYAALGFTPIAPYVAYAPGEHPGVAFLGRRLD